jgi:5'-methylthioadenosine phosphorylase
MEPKPVLGVIGGSGLYAMEGLESVEERAVETPFGAPSAPVILGTLRGKRVAFLARHGRGHHLSPSGVNYRANLYALKMVGVERVLSVSACGSLREDFAPGDIVVPGQLYDNTRTRERSFFGEGLVGHVSVADPFCPALSAGLAQSVTAAGGKAHVGGTLITIEGPRFSTRAESNTYRGWGMAIIGMTTSPEAFLAREAEMCYAVMAHVTDYDVWHLSEAPVTVDLVIRTLQHNTQLAQKAIGDLITRLPEDRPCGCGRALEGALITDPAAIPPETRKRLALLVDKYLA